MKLRFKEINIKLNKMDAGLNNLSISDLKKIKKDNQQKLKKESMNN